ncbi:hypothetical protein NNJEOMEG_01959 [Fundidesulfovibrio magnetotacticus]|uniref:Tetratricopeptide repeat protein n=1 Tax=Fundidesulfovibrio magnetotacticus TaxID=2730080 RepID=A0A6V8LT31_9BACT|nr:tetratricopeptide repeat protein [Fundidesulfovibrio magnetotacticus]GFK94120.1 hypothetical protein NNJEOMEG_01959 [Fundidesulfovibrio magnetotacticus]
MWRRLLSAFPMAALLGLAAAIALAQPTVTRDPSPDHAVRAPLNQLVTPAPAQPDATVQRDDSGTLVSPYQPAPPGLAMGRNQGRASIPLDMENINQGWDHLNAGQPADALAHFEKAQRSKEQGLAAEATLGSAYALWRLGRETQAAESFKTLVDAGFRLPETLPNLLFLLHKRGGPKAVEPYLQLLPEEDRARWRK